MLRITPVDQAVTLLSCRVHTRSSRPATRRCNAAAEALSREQSDFCKVRRDSGHDARCSGRYQSEPAAHLFSAKTDLFKACMVCCIGDSVLNFVFSELATTHCEPFEDLRAARGVASGATSWSSCYHLILHHPWQWSMVGLNTGNDSN